MKKPKKDRSMLCAALAGFVLFGFPIWIIPYAVWSTNLPTALDTAFPEGTQILEQTDTHRGLYRREGVAVVVAQVPAEQAQSFEQALREEGLIEFPPLDHVREILESVEAAAPVLAAEHVLWTYEDKAIALAEEPFSDWFAAVYDPVSGICCCVEYDA